MLAVGVVVLVNVGGRLLLVVVGRNLLLELVVISDVVWSIILAVAPVWSILLVICVGNLLAVVVVRLALVRLFRGYCW